MKKVFAAIIAVTLLASMFVLGAAAKAEPALLITPEIISDEGNTFGNCSAEVKTEDGIKFAHIETSGDDPWVVLVPAPETDVKNKYAAIKYRTDADESCGNGAFYTLIAEPHADYEIVKDGEWHVAVCNLSVASASNGGGENTSWNGKFNRMDILNGAPVLNPGQQIDIAWVAFFDNEDDANAYDGAEETAGLVVDGNYEVSYVIDKTNATAWSNGQIGDISVTYFFNVKNDGLEVAVRALGLAKNDLVQLNFNPGNKLWETAGQFISFKLGDTLTILQHNHKNGLLDDDNAGGADITAKVANEYLILENGFEFTAKLPKELFTITDVEGADSFVFGQDDLYFGMFVVGGGGGLSNQQNANYSDWTCKGLNLNEYKLAGKPSGSEGQPQTGDLSVGMFAVIAVLAMGAAVVFMKKKSF